MRESFLAEVEGFLRESRLSERNLGWAVAHNTKLLQRLRAGVNISFKTVDSFERFAAKWRADQAARLAAEGRGEGTAPILYWTSDRSSPLPAEGVEPEPAPVR